MYFSLLKPYIKFKLYNIKISKFEKSRHVAPTKRCQILSKSDFALSEKSMDETFGFERVKERGDV